MVGLNHRLIIWACALFTQMAQMLSLCASPITWCAAGFSSALPFSIPLVHVPRPCPPDLVLALFEGGPS